jgi:hypothetical protein
MTTQTLEPTAEDDSPFARDQWGRPLIPDPQTGEMTPYMRTSKFAGLLDPPWLRDYWQWWAVHAAVRFPHLAAPIALDGPKEQGTAVQELVHAAGMNEKRDKGTARHTLVRWALTGRDMPKMTRAQKKQLDAVADAVRSLGTITAVEKPLVCDEWRCAGSADYIGTGPDGTPFIADLKTGDYDADKGRRRRGAEYSWAVQLVTYARSVAWDGTTRGDLVAATLPRLVIVHAPQEQPDQITLVDIDPAEAKALGDLAFAIATAQDVYRNRQPIAQEQTC